MLTNTQRKKYFFCMNQFTWSAINGEIIIVWIQKDIEIYFQQLCDELLKWRSFSNEIVWASHKKKVWWNENYTITKKKEESKWVAWFDKHKKNLVHKFRSFSLSQTDIIMLYVWN